MQFGKKSIEFEPCFPELQGGAWLFSNMWLNQPCLAFSFSSRTDMDTARAPASRIGGCYDGKVTSYDRFWKLQADAINGPTRAGNTIPPFSWNDYPNTLPHYGQPTTFDFDWTTMKADW
mmetsp:Transcript_4321/g.8674  ORF Transcript_4321/g.8674 Transcript_4321/m.8674 type:complete len:119 (-) Transcript_4321:179-535(-)